MLAGKDLGTRQVAGRGQHRIGIDDRRCGVLSRRDCRLGEEPKLDLVVAVNITAAGVPVDDAGDDATLEGTRIGLGRLDGCGGARIAAVPSAVVSVATIRDMGVCDGDREAVGEGSAGPVGCGFHAICAGIEARADQR